MPRPVWTGSVSFGLVSLPVKLYTATENHDISFHNFERGSGERVRHKRVAEESGHEVDYDDIVKGYEIRPGEHVIVETDELDSVEPGRTRAIEIEDFVDLDAVDPIYFQKTYHVAPADEGSQRPYELLRRALLDADKVGIARFVMRGKQHLVALRTLDDILAIETMYFADEIRDPARIPEVDGLTDIDVNDKELDMARQLVDSLSSDWDPTSYADTYRERVLELLERKAEGESIVTESKEPESDNVVDLMAALEASLEEARGRRSRDGSASKASSDSNGLSSMTREELYEEAQRQDIGGRSKMSKEELIDALQQQEAS